MINHPSGESIMIFDSLIDPQNAEELKRTKTGAAHSLIINTHTCAMANSTIPHWII